MAEETQAQVDAERATAQRIEDINQMQTVTLTKFDLNDPLCVRFLELNRQFWEKYVRATLEKPTTKGITISVIANEASFEILNKPLKDFTLEELLEAVGQNDNT